MPLKKLVKCYLISLASVEVQKCVFSKFTTEINLMKRRLTGQAAVRYARYKTNSSAKAFANYSGSNYADEYLAECARLDARYQPGVRVQVKDYFPKACGCIGKIVRRVTKRKVAVLLENAEEHKFWLKQWQQDYAPASEDFLKFWDESAIYFELTDLEIVSQ